MHTLLGLLQRQSARFNNANCQKGEVICILITTKKKPIKDRDGQKPSHGRQKGKAKDRPKKGQKPARNQNKEKEKGESFSLSLSLGIYLEPNQNDKHQTTNSEGYLNDTSTNAKSMCS